MYIFIFFSLTEQLFIFFSIESVLSPILDKYWDSHGAKKALLFFNSPFGNQTGAIRGGNTQSVHGSQVDATRRLLLGFTAAAANASGVSVDVNAHALVHDGVGLHIWLMLVHVPVLSRNSDINQWWIVYGFFFSSKTRITHIQMMIPSWAERMGSRWRDKTRDASTTNIYMPNKIIIWEDYHLSSLWGTPTLTWQIENPLHSCCQQSRQQQRWQEQFQASHWGMADLHHQAGPRLGVAGFHQARAGSRIHSRRTVVGGTPPFFPDFFFFNFETHQAWQSNLHEWDKKDYKAERSNNWKIWNSENGHSHKRYWAAKTIHNYDQKEQTTSNLKFSSHNQWWCYSLLQNPGTIAAH